MTKKHKVCCNCKSDHIQYTRTEIYCENCGLVLAGTTEYVGLAKIQYCWGRIFG